MYLRLYFHGKLLDGHFVGYKMRYDGGSVVWCNGGSMVEFDETNMEKHSWVNMVKRGGRKESYTVDNVMVLSRFYTDLGFLFSQHHLRF